MKGGCKESKRKTDDLKKKKIGKVLQSEAMAHLPPAASPSLVGCVREWAVKKGGLSVSK